MPYEHLWFSRETPLTDRHRRRDPRPGYRPQNPRQFGERMTRQFVEARERTRQEEIGGYDERLLLKIRTREGERIPELEALPGVEVVSQEDQHVLLAFMDEQAVREVESRLTSLARDGTATRAQLFYALEAFDHWTADDRTGPALKQFGWPDGETFLLDVELWPEERRDKREAMANAFAQMLEEQGIGITDRVLQPSLLIFRLRCGRPFAETTLLRHRDVRMVDLPARAGVSVQLLSTDINTLPDPIPPGENAPRIAVLDSGITENHPLLKPAVGDARGFLPPHRHAEDSEPWHGTFVAGLAIYGDVADQLRAGRFTPELTLISGKVFEDDGTDQTRFVENAVEEAVRSFHEQYGCRVFNLSYGDLNKVYDGRHVRGLAYTLDRLSRELGVLFVVPTGNLSLHDLPDNPREAFPDYLLGESSRLLDPATALNALTVGGVARMTATRDAQRYPESIDDIPMAVENQPFPLTRCGPSVNQAIKPDVVEEAGNLSVMRASGRVRHQGLGILSLSGGFAGGHPFAEDIGTSYAAPKVANRAARLLRNLPNASQNLLRALVGAHSRWPAAADHSFDALKNQERKDRLARLYGYGLTDDTALFESLDNVVTLYAEDRIENDRCQFYELPIPDEFWSGGRRTRHISVALAYTPDVRTTRLDYRMTRLWFTLVTAGNLDEVEKAFQRNRNEGMGERSRNRWIANNARKNGTLQVSRWDFRGRLADGQRIFVVITRQDYPWSTAKETPEPYALAVVLDDRENNQAQLYAQVRARLQERARVRARARA